MKVLVTGGAGFIGSNLVEKLYNETDWSIDVVDHLVESVVKGNLVKWKSQFEKSPIFSNFKYEVTFARSMKHESDSRVRVSVQDFADKDVLTLVTRGNWDVIFHLAAQPSVQLSVEHPAITTRENVLKTIELVEAARKSVKPVRFIFSSSCAVYGNRNEIVHERTRKSPNSPYALQKSFIEDYLDLAVQQSNFDAMSLRYFNVYGPRQYANSAYASIITSWCKNAISGLPLRIDGDGSQTRDMIFVDDVANANIVAAKSTNRARNYLPINIATGQSISVNNILKHFDNLFPGIEVVYAPSRVGDVNKSNANIQLANEVLKWKPKVSFEQGLERTVEWWKGIK